MSLENEPSLTVKSKPLDSVAIDKMEQALERAKSLKNIQTSKASTSGAQEREEESSKEEDEDQVNKGAIEELTNQISDIQL